MVVEGVEETNSEEVMDKVITLLASMCKIVLQSNEIDKIHRYGKSVAGRPRPIIIRLMSHSSRDRILFSYRSLSLINEDLSYEVKTRRADIRAVAKQAKSSGAKVKRQGDRVYIDNTVFTSDTLKHIPSKFSIEAARTVKVNVDTTAFYIKYSILSNFYTVNFTVDGVTYNSVEQLYQYKTVKSAGRDDLASKIKHETDCVTMKRLGDSIQIGRGSDWDTNKLAVMQQAVYEKFRQNPHLHDALRRTGNTTLVESTKDYFWGTGATLTSTEIKTKTWKGRNQLGQILMSVRSDKD